MKTSSKKLKKLLAVVLSVVTAFGGMTIPTASAAAADGVIDYTPTQLRNVMYYGDWSVYSGQNNYYPQDVPADLLTHLNYAFLSFDANGNLQFPDPDAPAGHPCYTGKWGDPCSGILNAFALLRAENPNLRIGVSIGGWSKSNNFSVVAADASKRANFVSNVMKYVEYANLDFVDIDWEYPAMYRDPDTVDNKNDEGTVHAIPEDKENYTILLRDLKDALNKQGERLGRTYELSIAISAAGEKLDAGLEVDKVFDIIDFGNVMTYDLRGAWDPISGHQTGLYENPGEPDDYRNRHYSIDGAVKYLLAHGAPANKLVIGCAFYTRGWGKVANDGYNPSGMPGLFGTASKVNKDADGTESYGALNEAPIKDGDGGRCGGVWSYNALDKLKGQYSLTEYWDDYAKAPYMYNASTGQFFTYDNVRSIGEKTKYVKANGLGGCISWMASQDKATGGKARDELTKAIKEGLFGSAALPQYKIGATSQDISCDIVIEDQDWGALNHTVTFTIKNNATRNESGDLAKVEEMGEVIKCPLIYIKSKKNVTFTANGWGVGTLGTKDGCTTMDMSSIPGSESITQGFAHTFTLNCSDPTFALSDIEYVAIAQRLKKESAEISFQVIYGADESTTPTPKPTATPTVTSTPRPTATPTVAPTVTSTPKPTATSTPRPTVTVTATPTPAAKFTVNLSASTTTPDAGEKVKLTAVPKNAQGTVTYTFIIEDRATGKTSCVRSSRIDRTFLSFNKNQTYVTVEATDGAGNYATDYVVINPKGSIVPMETVATPSFSLNSGTYTGTQNVSISCSTSGATIRYTTDGSEPNASSSICTGTLSVAKSMTIKAKAFKSDMNDSATASVSYTIKEISGGGTIAKEWAEGQEYKLGDIVSYGGKYWECTYAHTSNSAWKPGNVPTLWKEYTGPVAPPKEQAATPTFGLKPGTYTSTQNVTLSTATAGATIYYTTDGSTPTTASSVYRSAIAVDKTTTIKAIAALDGMDDSKIASGRFVISTGGSSGNSSIPTHALIGYWHSWGGGPAGGVPLVKLRDIDENWDIINIAFAEPVSPGSTNGKMKMDLAGLTADYTRDDFKQDIKDLQAQGKKVVLSIGGYEGYFSLGDTSAVNQFVSDIKGFVDEFGFDGIDIDLEQSSVQLTPGEDSDFRNPQSKKIVNMITAIRTIVSSYGDDFILSWAPETFYMQMGYQFYGGLNSNVDSRAGSYLALINALREETTFVHVQLYNSIAITAPDGKSYSMGSSEATVAMCKMLLEGFNVNGNSDYFFEPLRPDQVAIGVPSSTGAAGSGHITNTALQSAFSTLVKDYPDLRGIMTWSITWDAYQNKNSFAQSNGTYLHALN